MDYSAPRRIGSEQSEFSREVIACKEFKGSVDGMCFKKGGHGLGDVGPNLTDAPQSTESQEERRINWCREVWCLSQFVLQLENDTLAHHEAETMIASSCMTEARLAADKA